MTGFKDREIKDGSNSQEYGPLGDQKIKETRNEENIIYNIGMQAELCRDIHL
jgi:hypothetical protein